MPRKGAFRVYDITDPEEFNGQDLEFEKVFALSQKLGLPAIGSVKIAVPDCGVFAQTTYLKSRYLAGRCFMPGQEKDIANMTPVTEGKHGTQCAGNAAFGCPQIKIIDVQVIGSQEGGSDSSDAWMKGVLWALGKGAHIVSSSIYVNLDRDDVQRFIAGHNGTFFVLTAGNEARNLDVDKPKWQGAKKSNNVVIVAACNRDGKAIVASAESSVKTAFGEKTVDLVVPGDGVPNCLNRETANVLQRVKQQKWQVKADEETEKQRRGFQQELKAGEEKAREAVGTDREQFFQNALKRKQTQGFRPNLRTAGLGQRPEEFAEGEFTSESDFGVSFGIPLVANIAAKMKLICSGLTPQRIRDILIATATGKREIPCAGGLVDPEAAYLTALQEAATKASAKLVPTPQGIKIIMPARFVGGRRRAPAKK